MKKLLQLVLIVAIAGIGTLTAQNLMVNGDVESWTAGVPDNWTVAENIAQESTTIHSGLYSAKHTSELTTKDFQQIVSGVQSGTEYTISYWFYDNDPLARTRIWAYWMNSGNNLSDNGDVLRPSTYSVDNAAWQEFSVTLTAPPSANEFKFEVRVYKQDGVAGGSVYYDDFLFSGDVTVNPEPDNYPTSFSATSTGTAIDLSWVDATGTQLPSGYIIMAGTSATLPVPADGTPVADDPDLSDGSGAMNIAFGAQAGTFSNLDANTTYYFSIYPYSNGGANIDFKNDGTAPTANATTANIVTLEFENFDVDWGNWMAISVIGDEVWDRNNTYGLNGTACAQMSGYNGGALDNEDWLISPALNLDENDNEVLNFFTAKNYTGPDLECLISLDYSGSGDPNAATWTSLLFTPSPGTWEWTPSGSVDLSGFSGTAAYIGYKFTSTTAGSATWELEDISITTEGTAVPDPEPSNYPTVFTANVTGTSINLTWVDAIGTQLPAAYIIYASVNSSLPSPVDGIPVADDTDMSDGSGALNVDYGMQQAIFASLDTGTTYYFSIYPYTNGGADIDFKNDGVFPTADATTPVSSSVVIEEQNFDISWGNWTTISVIGDEVWDRDNTYGIDGTPCAKMSGYSGAAFDNEDWLISPTMNFKDYTAEGISFMNAMNYTGPDLELLISTDYDGGADPNAATWTTLSYNMAPGGSWDFVSSGDVDLSAFDGAAVYVALKFTSTTAGSATWEIDNIVISGDIDSGINEDLIGSAVRVYPNPANDIIYLQQQDMDYTSVSLRSVDGSMIKEVAMNSVLSSFEVSGLNAGIYFLVFNNEKSGLSRIQKVVVK